MKLKLQVVQKKALAALAIHNTPQTTKEDWDLWAFSAKVVFEIEGTEGEKGIHYLVRSQSGELLWGLPPNFWAVLQKNGDIRVYSDEKFHLIYETL
jgi:hypothetical protein